MGRGHARAEKTDLLEPIDRPETRRGPVAFDFPAGLGEMHVHPDIVAVRDLFRLPEGLFRRRVDALYPDGGRHQRIAFLLGDERVRVLERTPLLSRLRLIERDP